MAQQQLERCLTKVVWSEGMHLSQHHFQLQSRFHQDATAFALSSLLPDSTGLIGCELDHDALLNGMVSVGHARGVMPDGMPFQFPEDPPPSPIDVRELFSPTAHSHVILLAIPSFRSSRANCAVEPAAGEDDTRFVATTEEFDDETTGADPKPVTVARKNFRLVLDNQETEGLVTLPIARVTRDGSGSLVYDSNFIPESLQIGASERLLKMLAQLLEMLESKAAALTEERRAGSDPSGERTGGASEIASFWLSHTVQSAIPPLRHHLTVRTSHPEQVFLELARLAGALCTFSMETEASQLPVYQHSEPELSFEEINRHVRRYLDVVVPQNTITLQLRSADGSFYNTEVRDPRAFRQSEWFLGVTSSAGRGELDSQVPRLVKICSARHIERLVKEAYPGLELEPVSALPAGIQPRPAARYFRIGRSDPCWKSIVDSGAIGAYIPASIPDPTATITILLSD